MAGAIDIPDGFAQRIADNVSRRLRPTVVSAEQVRRVLREGKYSVGDERIGAEIVIELIEYGLREA